MRAGYVALGLAMLLAAGLGGIVGWLRGPGPEPGPGPIAVALGLGGREATGVERRRAGAVADATTSCMAARGLSYRAVPAPMPSLPDADLGPLDWAARWGFGVSTSVGARADAVEEDPTLVSLASLAPTERSRLERALYGDGRVPGCQAAATDLVYGLRTRALAPIAADLAGVEAAIEADPTMAAVRTRWRDCVADVAVELGTNATRLERSTMLGRLYAHFAERTDAVRTDRAALGRLQATERRVAVTVARCEADFVRDRGRIAEPYEASYVSAHERQLARIAGVISAAEGAYPSVAP